MRRTIAVFVLIAAFTAAPARATEHYEDLALADALDEKCGFLPYIEHEVLGSLTDQAVSLSNMASTALKMGDDSVADFYKAQKAKAAATDCTQENGTAIVAPLRGEILTELLVAASTAIQLDEKARTPSPDIFSLNLTVPPSQDQLVAAQLVANYVAGQLGANAQGYFDRAIQIAANRIANDPDGEDYQWSVILYGVDYQARAEADKRHLVAGPYPWQTLKADDYQALSQRKASFGKGYSAFLYLIVRDGAVYVSAHEMDKGAIAGQTGLRVYVRKPEAPTNKDGLPLIWDASWRSQARAFDLGPVSGETAFGGALYRLPPEAVAAIQALNDDDRIEVAIVQGAEDQAGSGGSSRSTFDVGPVRSALKP